MAPQSYLSSPEEIDSGASALRSLQARANGIPPVPCGAQQYYAPVSDSDATPASLSMNPPYFANPLADGGYSAPNSTNHLASSSTMAHPSRLPENFEVESYHPHPQDDYPYDGSHFLMNNDGGVQMMTTALSSGAAATVVPEDNSSMAFRQTIPYTGHFESPTSHLPGASHAPMTRPTMHASPMIMTSGMSNFEPMITTWETHGGGPYNAISSPGRSIPNSTASTVVSTPQQQSVDSPFYTTQNTKLDFRLEQVPAASGISDTRNASRATKGVSRGQSSSKE